MGCQKPFYPPGELEKRSQIFWWGFGAFVLHITLTSCQTLRKTLSTFDISWMKVIFLLKACQTENFMFKMLLAILLTPSLNTPQMSANESDINVKSQLIHSFPLLSDFYLSEFHLIFSQKQPLPEAVCSMLKEKQTRRALHRQKWAEEVICRDSCVSLKWILVTLYVIWCERNWSWNG